MFSYNKSYTEDLFTEQITKEESYLFSLTDFVIGFQYTFYTYIINDIYLYITYPVGIYPAFYVRSDLDVNITEPNIITGIGYRATAIFDPILLSINPSMIIYFNIPSLIESKDKWTTLLKFSCKVNLTIVLNSIISTSFSITPKFTLPQYYGFFESLTSYELYKLTFEGEVTLGLRLSENLSCGLSISSALTGYLLPSFEFYFTIKS